MPLSTEYELYQQTALTLADSMSNDSNFRVELESVSRRAIQNIERMDKTINQIFDSYQDFVSSFTEEYVPDNKFLSHLEKKVGAPDVNKEGICNEFDKLYKGLLKSTYPKLIYAVSEYYLYIFVQYEKALPRLSDSQLVLLPAGKRPYVSLNYILDCMRATPIQNRKINWQVEA